MARINNMKAIGLMAVVGFYMVGTTWAEDIVGHHHPGSAPADDPLPEYVEMNCSMNEAFNQSCFHISKAECITLLPDLYARCDQEPSNVLFDSASEDSTKNFAECLEAELLKHLEAKGIDFDRQCE